MNGLIDLAIEQSRSSDISRGGAGACLCLVISMVPWNFSGERKKDTAEVRLLALWVTAGEYRSPSPRGRCRSRAKDLPTSLLVRNLRHDCRPEDLRGPFGEFGPLKDIYLPRDYYTGEPRGFGFVQYVDPDDAAEAKYQMDGQVLLGRELTVVFAEENRKKPSEMRARERISSIHAVVDGGRLLFVILDHPIIDIHILPHHAMLELTLVALIIILPLRGEDMTRDPVRLEAAIIGGGLTQGHLVAQGAGVEAR
ncbi:UNVERIFIED_CONTAM: Serine/arginine-rich SC35-like splicing factor SCL33 [Sesamum angustifolium]|uniref:Serine/arginine-rich SC35-like splicing factor SCL33 n=1 Tax=Sesamum angustifolium TaxID=2727405 RepID=A0AAW2MUZ2_9LAMI